MDFNDATRDIQTKYPMLNTSDLRNMMDDEIRSEEDRLSKERGLRDKYQRAVTAAHSRILDWIGKADEYQIDDVASFIASHRRACCWAVLIGQRLKAQAHAGHALCLFCGECATCNVRPCRDGAVHRAEVA